MNFLFLGDIVGRAGRKIVIEKAQSIARKVAEELGGYGIFGVELFVILGIGVCSTIDT